MLKIRTWKRELAALLAGTWMTFSFAPYDFYYLPLLSLAVYYRCCRTLRPGSAAWLGFVYGLGYFGSGLWWSYISIHDFGGAPAGVGVLLTTLVVATWSLFPALNAFICARLFKLPGAYFQILAGALTWAASEYLRGTWAFNGFPWLLSGYSQLESPLAGYAPLTGVFGLGFLLSVSAISLEKAARRELPAISAIVLLGVIWSGGWALRGIEWTQAIGGPIRVALIQGNVSQDQKWQADQRTRTLNLYRQATEQLWGKTDVVVWPETAVPAFLHEVEADFLLPLHNAAREHGTDIVLGLPTQDGSKRYYNSILTLGNTAALYHKIHLLPFGEYLPLQPLSGWLLLQMDIPLGDFAAGSENQALLRAGGFPFVATICYEDTFGELVGRQIEAAAYLLNVTNDAWFGDSEQPHQHMQMAQMRALEYGRYLLRATNTGLTGIVAPNGTLIAQAPMFSPTVVSGEILPMGGLTPYARLGDKRLFAGLLLLTLAAYAAAARLSAKRRRD
ncbi:apolipoprotein N-acyltransferase [Methylomonas rhizoryzae]|uniref:apolipoprotein N-acyltransferase n=1 Tax=Methylomonas rhizoryzae TaxID=2608981 RepID=UPI001E31BC51|nr:apolipoprotein N-acyltransferase [Methylomonas rhizoryzae]